MNIYPSVDYGHTPYEAAFARADVYDIGPKPQRAGKRHLKLGIVGCGGVVQAKWLPAIRRLQAIGEPVSIAGVADPSEAARLKMATLGAGAAFAGLDDLITQGRPDLVLIAAADAAHASLARQAIEAGIACLVEKPLAPASRDAAALVDLAARKNVLLASVANKRFSPPYELAKALIKAGALKAEPTIFSGKFHFGYPYVDLLRSGTIHLIDLMLWLMGPAEQLHALGRLAENASVESAVVSVKFRSGAIGTLMTSATALSFAPWERVDIHGRNAFLVVDNQTNLDLHDEEGGPAKQWRPSMPNTLIFDESFGGYAGLLENALDAVRGLAPISASGADGLAAIALIEAVERSLETGRAIHLSSGDTERQ